MAQFLAVPPMPTGPKRHIRRLFPACLACGLAALLAMAGGMRAAPQTAPLAELRAAVARQPDSAEAHNELAAALGEAGQLEEAIREAQAAIRIRPDSAEAFYNLGTTYVKKARQARPPGTGSYYNDLD